MSRTMRTSVAALALAGTLTLWSALGRAGEEGGGWKPFIPAEASKDLVARSAKRAEALAGSTDKKALENLQAEGMILAGLTLAAQDGKELAGVRQAALDLADAAGKGDAAAAKKLAGTLGAAKGDAKAAKVDWSKYDLDAVMNLFRPKAQGGEGLADDLAYTPKLKNLNSSEEFLNALAKKEPAAKNVEKFAKELPNYGYRIAVIGAITRDHGPTEKGKADVKGWQKLSDLMRDGGVELAAAGAKKDAAGIHAAAQKLEASCVQCHKLYR